MASFDDLLKNTDQDQESVTFGEITEDSPSGIGTFMAGIGSGFFKIPEGIVSLGATLIDLGAGTDTATDVEEFFATINPFDEYAQQTTAGRISELLVNLAVPAGFAAKAAGKMADAALAAKKGGKYLKFGAQAGAAGAAEAAFIADVDEAGTIGDLVGGFTKIDRESDNPQTELLNRLKFGAEGALITGGLSGLFSAGKKLATEGNKLRFSNNKFNRALDKFGSKFRARSGKTQEFFDIETGALGERAADVNIAENVGFTIQKQMDNIFPKIKRAGDKMPDLTREKLTEEMGDALLSGKPIVNDAGQVIFGKMDDAAWLPVKNKLLAKGMTEEGAQEIFDELTRMRATWGTLFSGLGERLTPTDLAKFKNVMGDKWKTYLGANYRIFKNDSLIPALNYKPATEAVDKLKNLFIKTAADEGKVIGPVEAENLVADIYKNAKLPAGFNLDKSSDVIFKLPSWVARTALDDAADFKGIANMSELKPEFKPLFEELFGKDKSALQAILNGTNKLSLITRRNQMMDNIVKTSAEQAKAIRENPSLLETGLRPMLAETNEDAVKFFGDEFRRINMDPAQKLAAGSVDMSKLTGETLTEATGAIAQGITNPLNGKFAINGIADALETTNKLMNSKSMVGKLYENFILYPKATSQIAKTILSPITHVRNFLSASAFATANGIIPNPQAIKDAYGALQTGLKGTRQQNELYQKLLRLGVVNSQVQVGDLVKLLEDVKFGETLNSYNGLQRLLKPFRKFGKGAQDLYTAEDDFWKIASWAMEKSRMEKAFARNGLVKGQWFTDAAGKSIRLTDDYFERQAANIVKNNIPNYSYVSDFVKGLRKLPVGNFVSFPAEIMRTSTNIVKKGLDEIAFTAKLADGTVVKPLENIGYTRLAGMAATTLAVPYAAVEGAKALYNVTEDEMDAMRRYVADWSKNSTLIPLRDKETGKLKYIDFSHMNAYDTITRPIQTVLNKVGQGETDNDGMMDDFMRGMIESTKELGMPFISESIWTEALTDIVARRGRTPEGYQVWNPEDTPGAKVSKMVGHLVEAQAPFNWKQLNRMKLSLYPADSEGRFDERGNEYQFGNELSGIAGLRAVEIDPAKGLTYKISELQKRERLAKDLFKRPSLKGGVVTPKEIVDAYINANRALFNARSNFMKDYDAAEILGISSDALDENMKRISKRDRFAIEDGEFKPYQPSRDIIDKFEENALRLGVSNPWIQAEPVIDAIKSLIEVAPLSLENLPDIENPFDVPETEVSGDAIAALNTMGAQVTGGDIVANLNQNYVGGGGGGGGAGPVVNQLNTGYGNIDPVTRLTAAESIYLDPMEQLYTKNKRKPTNQQTKLG